MADIRYAGRLPCHIRRAGYTTIDRSWNYDLYGNFWRLYLNFSKGASITDHAHPYKTHRIQPGHIYLIPSFYHCQTNCEASVKHLHLSFEPYGLVGQWSRNLCKYPIHLGDNQYLVSQCEELIENLSKPTATYLAEALAARSLFAWINGLTASYQQAFKHHLEGFAHIANAISYIDEHLGQTIRIGDLAATCSYSVDYFANYSINP